MEEEGVNHMTIKEEKMYYNEHVKFACEKLGITKVDYKHFKRIGDQLNAIYCQSCNAEISEDEYNRITDSYYKTANKMAKELKLNIFYQTDPRGATIYLGKDPIPKNNYNVATCIY